MSNQLVSDEIENGIATVTIDNPPMNPLAADVRDQLIATFCGGGQGVAIVIERENYDW